VRSALTTISVVALLAAGAAPAAARPNAEPSSTRTQTAEHAAAMRALGIRYEQLGAQAASRPAPGELAPPRVVRTAVADPGFDWADAGIGAGLTVALLLAGAGAVAVRRHPPMPAR
jgi:hypothetical protein